MPLEGLKGQGRRIFTLSIYSNKRGEQRVAVQMPYAVALQIATDDLDALQALGAAIKRRIETEESRGDDDGEA